MCFNHFFTSGIQEKLGLLNFYGVFQKKEKNDKKIWVVKEAKIKKETHFYRKCDAFKRRTKNEFKKTPKVKWFIDETKYLKKEEVEKLLEITKKNKQKAEKKGQKIAVRNYCVLKISLCTGLRVQELADLKCGDFTLGDIKSYVFVRCGKYGKSRRVQFNGNLKQDIVNYLEWKEKNEEETSPEAPFFLSSNTKDHMSTRALQRAFKRALAKATINLRYSIHATRHTYACHLYKDSGHNIVFVQQQLGHSSVKTTEVYADVFDEDRQVALEKLYC